ncbi:MAG TPA: hypothetical protein VGR95_21490 [Thermoanaerobaculia bacterium]|jgi:hypothetical protein|nr:hypothetical protein [Thermoanaerobaculia bacterium]
MSSPKRRYTDDEVEQQTIERLNDPNAWEAPIYVPPLTVPRPAWVTAGAHLELAARHYLVSVFHRLGAEANVTSVHPAGVDITVVLPSGQALTIDVKTLSRTDKWPIGPFATRPYHYVAFVVFSQPAHPEIAPQIHLVRSDDLRVLTSRQKGDVLPVKLLGKKRKLSSVWEELLRETAA